jgi:hypothetical protein
VTDGEALRGVVAGAVEASGAALTAEGGLLSR